MTKLKTTRVEPLKKAWLSTQEACAYLGCSKDFLQTLREKAEVSFSRYGKSTWYQADSIERFLERNRVL